MSNYIKEQSAGEIISNTFKIYIKNFRVLFLIMILPIIPLSIIELLYLGATRTTGPFFVFTKSFQIIILIFVNAPIAVAVSDYCLGNSPGVRRSYKRLTSVFWKFLGTFFLVSIIEIIGYMLLVVPGIIVTVLFLFVMTIVPLERRGGMDALKRSIALGKGYRWRNLGVFALAYLILIGGMVIIVMPLGILTAFISPEAELSSYLLDEIAEYIGAIIGPIGVIPLVLLYYDMRVRKENYDTAALAQDMMG